MKQVHNTFGFYIEAREYFSIHSEEELVEKLKTYSNPFVLGGGSNILLTKDIENPVFQIDIKGISVEKQDDDFVWVRANAGENWHHFVEYCLANDWGGLENLSLIPGNVGTTPIQNIGAYGVEIKDVMESCEAINVHSREKKIFTNAECKFAYRESVFKNEEKGNYIITSVIFKLTKRNHFLRTKYGAIEQILSEKGITNPTPAQISQVVVSIRKSKLPDPAQLGNSGSFFKNPIIQRSDFERIKEQYFNIPSYNIDHNWVKIPAAWLIETCGLKGYRKKDAGVHQHQPLVLVNYGKATGNDVLELAYFVRDCVLQKFNIRLEFEVNVF